MSSSVTPLVVSRSWRHAALVEACHFLDYQYSSEPRPYTQAAWQQGDQVFVEQRCEALSGGFRQQALNSLVAKRLLADRPSSLIICGLEGASLDLPRVASFLGFSSQFILTEPAPKELPQECHNWVRSCLSKAERVYVLEPLQAAWQQCLHQLLGDKTLEPLTDSIDLPLSAKPSNFDYASYEFCQRDHSLLCKMQEIECHHFAGCERVLDLGCGAGIFLQLLAEQGIDAVGVERDAKLVAYGREMGLAITEADALDFLRNNEQQFDGIYCSHFIEHLPFSALQELIELLSRCLAPGGRLLLSFPDPESIRSQLLGFWRDPEHVRYYHPELVQTLAAAEGLKLDWSSYQQQPHNVAPFQVEPQALPENLQRVRSAGQDQPRNDNKDEPKRMVQKIAAMLGLATRAELTATYSRLAALEQDLAQQYRYNQALEERTEALWQVNQTWAWNDNATLRFTK